MLIHRYVDDHGKRHVDFVKEFNYELYLKSDYTVDAQDIHKNSLKRYTFNTLKDMAVFVRDNGKDNIYGNIDPVSQFITKTYPNEIKLTNDYVTLNFDIETVHGSGKPKYRYNHIVTIRYDDGREQTLTIHDMKKVKQHFLIYDEDYKDWKEYANSCYAPQSLDFPNPYLALYEVLSISLISSQENVIYVFGTEEYKGKRVLENYTINHIKVVDEKELLIEFLRKWREIKPDIVTGWNCDGFDIPYIINRIINVLGEKYVNLLSPASKESKNCIKESQKDDRVTYEIIGITIYDYMDLYKKFMRDKKETYKLDYIGEVEVNHRKVSFPEYNDSLMLLWEYDYDKFIEYNAVDTLIVNKLDDKLKYINLAITIAHITKTNLSNALGTVKIWDDLIFSMLYRKHIQIPPNISVEKDAKFIGAYVKVPILGAHGWVITFDLTSLYPSIIRMLGLSPETLLHRQIGGNIDSNNKILNTLNRNLDIINDLISIKKKS